MNVLFRDDFSGDLSNWWVEGGQRVWVEDGRLYVRSDPPGSRQPGFVCTVWCRQQFSGDLRLEVDAHVLESQGDCNNINFFLLYSDPAGTPLYDTRDTRADAGYDKYHNLNGYIFTYLNDTDVAGGRYDDGSTKARIRIRRCPGFELLNETFTHHCRRGVTYRLALERSRGQLSIAVDGRTLLTTPDDRPHASGLIGLRTYQTYLWCDNVVVSRV